MLLQLHVIVAGSLLDFELENIGLPVGRVASIYMHPLSFMEFLAAKNESLLIETIIDHDESRELNGALHNKLLLLLGEYMTVRGMPSFSTSFQLFGSLLSYKKNNQTAPDNAMMVPKTVRKVMRSLKRK
ncbi:MAG TPA: hypothetical protein VK469_01205 [Candidatus Kapabacteria bacterium]|nr:hypothetical protein [Candidatus Kapabacteria bacterium]